MASSSDIDVNNCQSSPDNMEEDNDIIPPTLENETIDETQLTTSTIPENTPLNDNRQGNYNPTEDSQYSLLTCGQLQKTISSGESISTTLATQTTQPNCDAISDTFLDNLLNINTNAVNSVDSDTNSVVLTQVPNSVESIIIKTKTHNKIKYRPLNPASLYPEPSASGSTSASTRNPGTGTGNVILIKVTDSKAAELLTDPFQINELIYSDESPFNQILVKDLRVNRKKGIIVIETEVPHSLNLPNIKTLGQYEVLCYRPKSDVFTYGIIGPIAVTTGLDFLKEKMIFSPHAELINLERMKRRVGNRLEDSLSVKITFKDELPDSVKVCGLYFKIRTYVPPPVQCFNCQRYGHTAGSCKAHTRCLLCSENHKKEDCRTAVRKCANCSENHVASSKECRFMKNAREIESVKINEKVTHEEARSKVHSQKSQGDNFSWNASNISQQTPTTNTPTTNSSYSSVIQRNTNHSYTNTNNMRGRNTEPYHKQKTDASTQTEPLEQNKIDNTFGKDFFQSLRNFVLDVLSINFRDENNNSKKMLADSAIRNHFGVDLRKDQTNNVQQVEETNREEESKDANENKGTKRKTASYSSEDDTRVISNNDEDDEMWETIEKRQVKKKGRADTQKKKKMFGSLPPKRHHKGRQSK